MRNHPVRLKDLFLNRYTAFLAFVLAATFLVSRAGGLPGLNGAWRTEIPLLLYLYFALNRITRPGRWQPWVAALPLVTLYAVFEAGFLLFGRIVRAVEILELPELAGVLPPLHLLSILLLAALPPVLLLLNIDWRRGRNALVLIPAAALAVTVHLAPDPFLAAFRLVGREVVTWSDSVSIGNNGRLSMLLYHEAQRRSSVLKTARYRTSDAYGRSLKDLESRLKPVAADRNVHLIVLESFLDPTLFKNVRFSQTPVDPDFQALFKNATGFSISPVFAGGTAQAEFEVLCGVPAFQELSSVEFNVFTGARTYCLPGFLQDLGYRTFATNAFKPNFFNAIPAYRGMGFEKVYFPREYAPRLETYLQAGGELEEEWYMFDGDLLQQNLNFVRRELEGKKGPLFNYVLGIYGHFPHYLDEAKRPPVIRVEAGSQEPQFERAVNQHYYRTKAIARYVRELMKIDPRSLIVLVSDHLPALDRGVYSYRDLGYLEGTGTTEYLNRLYILENGKAVTFNTLRHFELSKIVLNYVSQGRYCRENACGLARNETPVDRSLYHDSYMAIMAFATEARTGNGEPPAERN